MALIGRYWPQCCCTLRAVSSISDAQVIRTLPPAGLGTTVTPTGNVFEHRPGDDQKAVNLFHSFGQFSIGAGNTANFSNARTRIQNIMSRVTGGQCVRRSLALIQRSGTRHFGRQSFSDQSGWCPVWPECSAQCRRLFSRLDGRLRQARDRWHFLRRSGKSKRADFGTSVRVRLSHVQPCSDRRSDGGV